MNMGIIEKKCRIIYGDCEEAAIFKDHRHLPFRGLWNVVRSDGNMFNKWGHGIGQVIRTCGAVIKSPESLQLTYTPAN